MRKWIEKKPGLYTLDTGLFVLHVGYRDKEHGFGYAYLKIKSKLPYWTLDKCKWAAVKSAQGKIKEAWKRLQ